MHELSLCENLLKIIEENAQKQGFQRVHRVRLKVGTWAGVEIEALRFGFEIASRDTCAQGAILDILDVPAQAWCFACGQTITIRQRYDPCPHCGGYERQITGGEDLAIYDLDVE